MQLLDEALSEVDTIEGKLSSYEEMLQSVKEQMDQISQSNRLIQISNTNNGKLLDEIQFLVVSIVGDVGGKVPVSVGLFGWFASLVRLRYSTTSYGTFSLTSWFGLM